jgi:hypothetical protein
MFPAMGLGQTKGSSIIKPLSWLRFDLCTFQRQVSWVSYMQKFSVHCHEALKISVFWNVKPYYLVDVEAHDASIITVPNLPA